jgi:hypothetical protein
MAKYKRTNLGTKSEYDTVCTPAKNKINYPSFYVRKKLPLDKSAIGKTFEVKAKIKLVGLDQNTSEDRDDLNYNFNVINIEF